MKFTRISFALVLVFASLASLSAQETPTADPATPAEAEIQTYIQDVVDNPATFAGTVVTLEGVVGELINVRAFTLLEDAALGVDGVLVVNNSGQPFDLNLSAESRVLVTGTVRQFARDENFADTGYYADYRNDMVFGEEATPDADAQADPSVYADPNYRTDNLYLYDTPLNDYTEWTVIAVNNIENIVPAVTLQALASGAEPYNDGRVYAIEGYVNELLNANTFTIGEGAVIGNAQVMVFADGDLMTNVQQGDRVRVYGPVSGLYAEDFAADYDAWGADYGYGFAETYDQTWNDTYADWEAVFAEAVVELPQE